ncbi:hypothetical protein TWF173_011561 [Orbilia oligospora]|nr:hypothetical protein TWF173_011561 [Orbilia oligospora]
MRFRLISSIKLGEWERWYPFGEMKMRQAQERLATLVRWSTEDYLGGSHEIPELGSPTKCICRRSYLSTPFKSPKVAPFGFVSNQEKKLHSCGSF